MGHVLTVIGKHSWIPLFLIVEMLGICLIPLDLPGLWVQFGAALIAAVVTRMLGLASLPWLCAFIIFFLALNGEIVNFMLGKYSVERAKGSALAAWLSLFGGFIFGFFGVFIPIPIPVLGSLIGSVIMTFIGAFSCAILGEWIHLKRRAAKQNPDVKGNHLGPALKVGTWAVIGRASGIAAKLWFAFVALAVACAGLIWDMLS